MKNLTFKRIYTGDYTDIGHHDGVNDGKQGKPKSHFGVLTQRHWFNKWFWQADDSFDSYVSGYNKGYEGGQRIRENIYHQTNVTGENMSNPRNFDAVLAGLMTAKGNIQRNIQQLESELNHYSKQIEAMQQVGFLEDYTEKLKAYKGLKQRIDKLQEFLQQVIHKITEIEGYVQQLKIDSNRND